MEHDGAVQLDDGRMVAYVDYGGDGAPVLWCHGGPGSRREPEAFVAAAAEVGLRLIGVDRPGYGGSTAVPGRTIAGWVPDAVALLDALGLEQVAAVGVSTGGAYALALASMAPERVSGVVACCALTDMRWAEGKAMMTTPVILGTWGAASREAAIASARETVGDDGSKLLAGDEDTPPLELAPSDLAVLTDPDFAAGCAASMALMFEQGVIGFVDDRLADGPGWGTFDVGAVQCPVVVVHGASDTVVPPAHAHHTAAIVPGARLELHEDLGHFSIVPTAVPAIASML